MAQHRTLKQICKRMGWKKPETAIRRVKQTGFPMYHELAGRPPKAIWVTNDDLIQLWELRRCELSRQYLIKTGKYERKERREILKAE